MCIYFKMVITISSHPLPHIGTHFLFLWWDISRSTLQKRKRDPLSKLLPNMCCSVINRPSLGGVGVRTGLGPTSPPCFPLGPSPFCLRCHQRLGFVQENLSYPELGSGVPLCHYLNQNPLYSLSFSFSFFLVALGLRGSPRTLAVVSQGRSWLRCTDFSLCWPLAVGSVGSSTCGSRALDHRLSSCGAWA